MSVICELPWGRAIVKRDRFEVIFIPHGKWIFGEVKLGSPEFRRILNECAKEYENDERFMANGT